MPILSFFRKSMKVEDQYLRLSDAGIRLKQGISLDEILDFERQHYEKDPYKLLLISLGAGIFESDRYTFVSNDIWHLDTECIYQAGDYVEIAKRMSDLTKGEFELAEIQDFIDLDEQTAWLEFSFEGQRYHWDLNMNDDWVDPYLFSKFVKLHSQYERKGKFTYLNLGGQDCLIGYCTKGEMKQLRKITKLDFQWLRE